MLRPGKIISLLLGLACAGNLMAANGVITGKVSLQGKPPTLRKMNVAHDVEVCGKTPRSLQSLELAEDGGIGQAIVYLNVAGVPGPATNTAALLDQRDCAIEPRVQIARSGAQLILRNHDPILHVVRLDLLSNTNPPAALATIAAPYAGFERKFLLPAYKDPTLLRVCGINGHEWMTSYIAVLPHPWSAVTDGAGKFTIPDVPPGAYRLKVWHETLGATTVDVTIATNRSAQVNVTLPAR
jgi:hypothetical protein